MPANLKSQDQWLDNVKTDGCVVCHQLGNKATRTIPKELGHFKSSLEAWQRRILSGQASEVMIAQLGRARGPARIEVVRRLDRPDRRGRTAQVQAAAPAGRRAQCRRHRVGLGHAEGLSARRDRHRPAQSHGQRQRQDLWRSRRQHRFRAGARPGAPYGDGSQSAGPRSEDADTMFISTEER